MLVTGKLAFCFITAQNAVLVIVWWCSLWLL